MIKIFIFIVQDPDGDDVRCRWASGSASVCSAFPHATLSGVSYMIVCVCMLLFLYYNDIL